MDVSAKIVSTVLLGVVASVGTWYMTHSHNRRVEILVDRIEQGDRVRWDVKTGAALIAEGEQHLTQARVNLNRRAYEEAQWAFDRFRNGVDRYLHSYGGEAVQVDKTLGQWVEEETTAYVNDVRTAFRLALEALRTGDLSSDRMVALCKYSPISRELFQSYRRQEDAIAAERAKMARHWLRVVFIGDADQYHDRILGKMREQWNDAYGYQLVVGRPVNGIERKSTWAEIEIKVTHEFARYELMNRSSGGKWVNWAPPEIPYQVRLEFNTVKSDDVPASWDMLAAVTVRTEVPETIRQDDADGHNKRVREELMKLAVASMAALPVFELFPGVDPSALALVDSGRIDLAAARALRILDPDRLVAETRDLVAAGDPGMAGDLMKMIVAVDMEDEGEWLAGQLAVADDRVQRVVYEELAKKPWFGEYRPLVALIKQGDQFPYYGLEAVRGHIQAPVIRETLLDQIQASTGTRRINYATLFLEGILPEEIPAYAEWIRDEDGNFAVTVFNQVQRRDHEFAAGLIHAEFDRVQPELKEWMLRSLSCREEGDTEPTLLILQQAALQKEQVSLRQASRRKIMKESYVPACWLLLEEIAATEEDGGMRQQMDQKLLYNVQRAQPDRAQGFLKEKMLGAEASLRDAAINILVGGDDPKQEIVREIHRMVVENNDAGFTRNVLLNMHQSAKLRQGWDFAQAELDALLRLGLAHEDPATRGYTYEILGAGMKKGQSALRKELQQALERETEPAQRKRLERLLRTG